MKVKKGVKCFIGGKRKEGKGGLYGLIQPAIPSRSFHSAADWSS